jgi:hypothetical protein
MDNITKVISVFAEIGVPKETTIEIMNDLLENSAIYADNSEKISDMIQSKLSIDEYISFTQYKVF